MSPEPSEFAILVTGRPGVGKTTLVRKVASGFGAAAGGFYTEEIREQGQRLGFRIVTLDGKTAVLSHVALRSPFRVGKYGVDLAELDRVGVEALREAARDKKLVVIDEIGKMELFSDAFKDIVEQIIKSGKCVLGSILLAANPWADQIRELPEVDVVIVTRENRDRLVDELRERLESCITLR